MNSIKDFKQKESQMLLEEESDKAVCELKCSHLDIVSGGYIGYLGVGLAAFTNRISVHY